MNVAASAIRITHHFDLGAIHLGCSTESSAHIFTFNSQLLTKGYSRQRLKPDLSVMKPFHRPAAQAPMPQGLLPLLECDHVQAAQHQIHERRYQVITRSYLGLIM